MAVARWAWGIS